MSDQGGYSVHATPPPSCYRHPGRVAWVRCQRCDRPVCTECQQEAAVGVQCPECVKRGRVRTLRNQFGSRAPRTAGGRPVATYTLIGLCVAGYLLQLAMPQITTKFAFAPVVGASEPWRFLTAAFLHDPSAIFHIAFNMYALWAVGPFLERALGAARFVATYLLSALAGSVAFLLLSNPAGQSWYTPVLGASGAVFGLFGAAMILLYRLGRPITQFVVILAINAVIGFTVPGIAWQAHVGGFVAGLAMGAVFAYSKKPTALVRWLAPAAMLVLLVVLTVVKYTTA